MNKHDDIKLYEHNKKSYNKIKDAFLNQDIVSIVHATGTGKSYNALKLACDNKDKNILYIVPNNSIKEHLKSILHNNDINVKNNFHNLNFITYQSLIKMTDDEIKNIDIDLLILDEFHHIGAPIWGKKIDKIIKTHKGLKIFGITAYTVRDRSTPYERDMINPLTNEIFSNSVISTYDLCDAMIDGVLPKPIYKSGYININKMVLDLEERLNKIEIINEDYKKIKSFIEKLKKRIHKVPNIEEIFKKNIKKNGKYIYFCPINSTNGINDIKTIMNETKKWIQNMGLHENDYVLYLSTSKMKKDGKNNRDSFYNDVDLNGNNIKDKLRIMFTLNQYNEGVHVPNIDGVIMGRETKSDIVFFEQLGRALSVRKNNIDEVNSLKEKNINELKKICDEREILYNENITKEQLINKLTTPIIIDLTNNIGFIKTLENNLKERIKLGIELNKTSKDNRKMNIEDASFDIDMIDEDLFEILNDLKKRLLSSWDYKYNLAKKYYEHYGNLEISQKFKTKNGIDYDENGIKLGFWINNQRKSALDKSDNIISIERKKLLDEIGMRWEKLGGYVLTWNEKYELAKKYYKHYGNIKVPRIFKTKNGVDYDEDGFKLGFWINNQRKLALDKNDKTISIERKKLLDEIGMCWKKLGEYVLTWNDKYEIAKKYYEHYGNLNVKKRFRTTDGINYDKNGFGLGEWLVRYRQKYNKNLLTKEEVELMNAIGMSFTNQKELKLSNRFNALKKYYEYYGNLDIPQDFKTSDGINYDPNGTYLKNTLTLIRNTYRGVENSIKINEDLINELVNMGVDFSNKKDHRPIFFELAKKYYEHYGNLDIKGNFKTNDGINYDEEGFKLGSWLKRCRAKYNKNLLTKEEINLLNSIGISFENPKVLSANKKYSILKKYYERYGNIDIPQNFKTSDGVNYDPNGVNLSSYIYNCKYSYRRKNELDYDKIKALEDIGMEWFTNELDDIYQSEIITDENIKRKKIEILNRVKSLINTYDSNKLPSKKEINENMLKKLDYKKDINKNSN